MGVFVQLGDFDCPFEGDLTLLFWIDNHQNILIFDHLLLLGKVQ